MVQYKRVKPDSRTAWPRALYRDAPGGRVRKFTLCVFLQTQKRGSATRQISRDLLRRGDGIRDYSLDKYVQLLDASVSGTLFRTLCDAGHAAELPLVPLSQSSKQYFRATAMVRTASGVELYKRGPNFRKVSHGVWHSQAVRQARCEVLAMAMVSHLCVVKRIPPWSVVPNDCGREHQLRLSGTNLIHTVDLVTESADHTLYDWLRRGLREEYAEGSPELLAFQTQLDGIFAQVVLALYAFQKYLGFVHNDLHLKNVLIKLRPNTENMRFISEDLSYVFREAVPLVKICDFGHAYFVNPVTRNVMHGAVYSSAFTCLNNSHDVLRFCMSLQKMRRGNNMSAFSQQLTSDLNAVLAPLKDFSTETCDSAEHFPFAMGGFLTPRELVRRGSVVKKFVCAEQAPAAQGSTFYELPHDDFEHDVHAASAFELREQPSAAEYVQFNAAQMNAEHTQIQRVVLPLVKNALHFRLNGKGSMTFSKNERGLQYVRKRMLWAALIVYQRAVMFYMRTFGHVQVSQQIQPDLPDLPDLLDVTAPPDEWLNAAKNVYAAFNPVLMESNIAMRYCLWAACGGFPEFFYVFSGIEEPHFRRARNDFTPAASNSAEARKVLELFDLVSSYGLRAPAQFVKLESVHAATELALINAFDVSSSAVYYSLPLSVAIDMLKI